MRGRRILAYTENVPLIFWYIGILGYVFTLATMYLTPPTTRRCVLVCFYSIIIGLVLYGIFSLSQPYSHATGVKPYAFERVLESRPAVTASGE